ncbi:hypothetical protein KSF78_0009567 [Schistosoma japonicum]|nr:hypothetical protein KSF78_0009567 [Schistosoma japonicum]
MTPNRVCTWVNIATRSQLRSVVHHSHASLSINEKIYCYVCRRISRIREWNIRLRNSRNFHFAKSPTSSRVLMTHDTTDETSTTHNSCISVNHPFDNIFNTFCSQLAISTFMGSQLTPNRVCTWVNIATRSQLRSVVHHSHASLSINEKLTPNRVCTWVNIATRSQLRSVVHHSHASLSINEKVFVWEKTQV